MIAADRRLRRAFMVITYYREMQMNYNDKNETTGGNGKAGALGYAIILLYALYFLILFAERTVAVVMGFVSDVPFYESGDVVQWYAHIVTAAALVSSFVAMVFFNGSIFGFLFTRRQRYLEKTDARNMAAAAGLILVGGMVHTTFTVLWLQFTAYGCLLISMLLRSIGAGMRARSDVTRGRLVVSYLYVVCFSMAIPVVYSADLGPVQTAFVVLEIVTALVLVAAFSYLLFTFYRSGGLLQFGIPLIAYTIAADIAIFVLRYADTANWFVLVFLILTAIFWLIGRIKYGNKVLPYFGGKYKKKRYFEGWYVKLIDASGKAVALIISYHAEASGERYSMLQFVGENSFGIRKDVSAFSADEDRFSARFCGLTADESGLHADIDEEGHTLHGDVRFGELAAPSRDIMGPFASFPLMECKHGVVSMMHSLSGQLEIDGRTYDFDGGTGYIEKDLGRSFPSEYFWTQASDGRSSVMAAVASIPYMGLKFPGCICFVYTGGREYRLATYNLAKADVRPDGVTLTRGRYKLEIIPEDASCVNVLAAPTDGGMSRAVHESVSARVRYLFTASGKTVFDMTCQSSGYEKG